MKTYRIKINGKTYEMDIELISDTSMNSSTIQTPARQINTIPAPVPAQKQKSGEVNSPMPGTILKIYKTAGDCVKKGDVILLLEAMKMENEIVASKDGIITKMMVSEGQTVAGNVTLFVIE